MSDNIAKHTSIRTIQIRIQILLPAEIIEKLSSVSKAISLMSSEPVKDVMNVTANGSPVRGERLRKKWNGKYKDEGIDCMKDERMEYKNKEMSSLSIGNV